VKIYASYNIKGGVGKTTAAVNLAYLSAADGDRTLLWDLDPQGAASFLFRIKPRVKGGGQALIQGTKTLDDAIKGTDFDCLDLLPADFTYRNMDLLLGKKGTHADPNHRNPKRGDSKRGAPNHGAPNHGAPNHGAPNHGAPNHGAPNHGAPNHGAPNHGAPNRGEPTHRIADLLQPLAAEYDTVFLDCPPSISLVSENVLHATDILVVPLIPTTLSVRTLDQLTDFVAGFNGHRPQVRAFFSMVDRRKRLHREITTDLWAQRPDVAQTAIPALSLIERMSIERAPVAAFAPRSQAALAYQSLWSELRPTPAP
jgi:cellulose biosynthesis protein BcsQ